MNSGDGRDAISDVDNVQATGLGSLVVFQKSEKLVSPCDLLPEEDIRERPCHNETVARNGIHLLTDGIGGGIGPFHINIRR